MNTKEKLRKEKIKRIIESFWEENGTAQVVTGKHSEFIIEPKIFLGNEVNPEVAKLIIKTYLAEVIKNDSGQGRVIATPEKLIIKDSKGNIAAIVRDKSIIEEYLSQAE